MILLIGMAAGALLYRWWLSKAKTSTTAPSYLITDEIPPENTAEKDLDLLKKDLRHRQNLQTSTPDWEDN